MHSSEGARVDVREVVKLLSTLTGAYCTYIMTRAMVVDTHSGFVYITVDIITEVMVVNTH